MQINRSVGIILALVIILSGCSYFQNRQAVYLDSVKGLATQAEVRQELGPPNATRQGEEGETIWVYELREQQSGNRFTAPGMWCEEYLLTFDDKAIFRRWKQVSHFHGGELMPKECIPGADTSKS